MTLIRMINFDIKRKRTTLNSKQYSTLLKYFQKSQFPDSEQRIGLANILGISPRSVQIWFQNQRQKTKNSSEQELQDETNYYESPCSSDTNLKPEYSGRQKSLKTLVNLACMEYYKRNGQNNNHR